jgi:hypothetical protein
MKRIFTLVSLIFLIQLSLAQNIENHSFDSVYIGGIDRIYSWITSDSWPVVGDTVFPMDADSHYTGFNPQYHMAMQSVQIEYSGTFAGPHAVKLFSDITRVNILGNPFPGFVVNGDHFYTDTAGYLDLKKCGTPFPYRPVKLRGHYKFVDNSPSIVSKPSAIVLLKKYNTVTQTADTVGYAMANSQLTPTTTWKPFELTVNYYSNDAPDSIVVALFSPYQGFSATFWVDSLGFEYSTPTMISENEISENIFYQDRSENKIYYLKNEPLRTVKIYDVNGKLVFEDLTPSNSIDISGLSNGSYFMKTAFSNNKSHLLKIIK